MDTTAIRDRIARYAEAMGYTVFLSHAAESKSAYVECSVDGYYRLKVRVSDHPPRYACDVDVSPLGCAWWEAVEILATEIDEPVPASVRAIKTRIKRERALQAAQAGGAR